MGILCYTDWEEWLLLIPLCVMCTTFKHEQLSLPSEVQRHREHLAIGAGARGWGK